MPAIQAQPLQGAGTFQTSVVPPTNTPVTVSASGSISFAPNSTGYITAEVFDSISGGSVTGIADMIRTAEQVSGTKSFNISALAQFSNPASLQVRVNTRQLDGADPQTAPAISSATLSAFAATQVAVVSA